MPIDAARLLRPSLCCFASGVLVLGACNQDRQSDPDRGPRMTAAEKGVKPVSRQPEQAQPTSTSLIMIEALTGLWRVAAVDGAGYSLNDIRAVNSLLEIQPEQMVWSHRASSAFPANDLCERPYAGSLDSKAADPILRARFDAALTRLKGKRSKLDPTAYEFDCLNGGRWGPGEIGTVHFYRVGEDALLMSWYDDTVLLLQRMPERGKAAPGRDLPTRADDYHK